MSAVWNVLFVDDDEDIRRQLKEYLEGDLGQKLGRVVVDVSGNFNEVRHKLDALLYDIVILDVFRGEQTAHSDDRPGAKIMDEIIKKCFVPIILFTALPKAVDEKNSKFIKVIRKSGDTLKDVKKQIISYIKSGVLFVNKALINHLHCVQAEYMWKFVEPNLKRFGNGIPPKELAYLLARRLAKSLSRDRISNLIDYVGGGQTSEPFRDDVVDPMEFYIYPPDGEQLSAGDIFIAQKSGKHKKHLVLLTPSCDMVETATRKPKSEFVLLAECIPMDETVDGKAVMAQKNKTSINDLVNFMKNNKRQADRYYFLPPTFFMAPLFVDFQQLRRMPLTDIKKTEKLASLDNPFAESLLNRFLRYFGRIGTPDLRENTLHAIAANLK